MIRIELIHGSTGGRTLRVVSGLGAVMLIGLCIAFGVRSMPDVFRFHWLSGSSDEQAERMDSPPAEQAAEPIPVSEPLENAEPQEMADRVEGEVRSSAAAETSAPTPSAIRQERSTPPAPVRRTAEWTAACLSVVDVVFSMPESSQLGLVSCQTDGRYELSGKIASSTGVAVVQQALATHLSDVSVRSQSGTDDVMHFFVSGRARSPRPVVLSALQPDPARILFAQVEYWADLCGIDGIALGDQSVLPAEEGRARWRRRLTGTASYRQIQAFLARVATQEEHAVLGELILTPVSGADSRDLAVRMSSAIDVMVIR